MSKNKKLVSVGLILILVGFIASLIGLFFGGEKSVTWGSSGINIYNDEKMVSESKNLEKFTDADLSISYGDVEIVKSDKYAIDYEYNSSIDKVTCEVNNGKLELKNKRASISFINIGITTKKQKFKIYIPEDAEINTFKLTNDYGNSVVDGIKANILEIYNDYGNVALNDISGGKLTIDVDSGKVNLGNVNYNEITAKSGYGSIRGDKINSKICDITLDSGSLELNSLNSDKAKIDNDYGKISLNSAITNGLDIKSNSGSVVIDGELKGINTINSDYGDIEIYTTLAREDYSYSTKIDYGKCRIGNNKYEGSMNETTSASENSFNITCDSGDLTIDFK